MQPAAVHQGQKSVQLRSGGHPEVRLLENGGGAEAPGVHDGGNGDVQGAAGQCAQLPGAGKESAGFGGDLCLRRRIACGGIETGDVAGCLGAGPQAIQTVDCLLGGQRSVRGV